METGNSEAFSSYKESFVRDFEGPYAIQWPGGRWKTRYKKVSDPLIRAHLDKKYWLATKAPWYPRYAYIDLDEPSGGDLERILAALNLSDGQYCLCTSPSWKESGNLHLIFAPRYRDRPVTKKLIFRALRERVKGAGAELYPQTRRKFRLPFGRDQYLVDAEVGAPLPYSWREALYWVQKLDHYPLEELSHQLELDLKVPRVETWVKREEAEGLLEYGLPGPGTRHNSCLILAIYFFRLNWDQSDVRAKLKRWLRAKHNGFSKEINKGNWRIVDREVDEIVNWTYEHYGRAKVYPDTTHNLEAYITKPDMNFIGEVFPGDIVNQRRLFKLICYYRPRSYYPYVFIPRWRWWEIAGRKEHYLSFRADLESRGLLETINSYQVGGYPKRFRLYIPRASISERVEEDKRAIQNFDEAVFRVFGSVRDVRDALRLPKQTAYDIAQRISPK